MEIIAKTTSGVLISASESEIKSILRATNGKAPEILPLGQKIPAIDYAGTITKLQSLSDDYHYQSLLQNFKNLKEKIDDIKSSVENATKI